MRIDSTSAHPQKTTELLARQQLAKEVAGEKEPDGDSDDMTRKAALTSRTSVAPASNPINQQGAGTKVDFFA